MKGIHETSKNEGFGIKLVIFFNKINDIGISGGTLTKIVEGPNYIFYIWIIIFN